jgi:NhaP-type Na+/H+ or K+/H+ antiporter
MDWSLAIISAALLAVAAISRRISGTMVTPAMAFVALGLLVGPKVLDAVDLSSTSAAVRALAEATLALVLFTDASRIDLRELRREIGVPARLLGIGLPLTIVLGALAAAVVFGEMSTGEALILGIILAPTDAALGAAVVTDERVPPRLRQGLNVESGLNDGICLPLLFAAIAAADVESHISHGSTAWTLFAEEIGYGVLGGVVGGLVIAAILMEVDRRGLVATSWRGVIPAVGTALAYGVAAALDGSGFIAAFVGGMVFRACLRRDPGELNRFNEEVGNALSGVTFLLFGAVLLGPALGELTWAIVLWALLSLTILRMAPVAIAMVGSRAPLPTLGFLGWFGPRGLASIVFAVILIEESNLPQEKTILLATYLTVGLSVLAHGLSAAPMAARYGRWFESHRHDGMPRMEAAPTGVSSARGAAANKDPADRSHGGNRGA